MKKFHLFSIPLAGHVNPQDLIAHILSYRQEYEDFDVFLFDTCFFEPYGIPLFQMLSTAEKEKASSLPEGKPKILYITRRSLIRCVLSDYMGMYPPDIQIQRDSLGKPYIQDSEIYFSFSHSRNMVGIAVSKKASVGIDVQVMKGKCKMDLLKNSIFSSNEQAAFHKARGEDEERSLFFDIWTRKEAFIKCIGTGFTMDVQTVSVNQNSIFYNGIEYQLQSGLVTEDCMYAVVFEQIIQKQRKAPHF